MYFCHIIEDRLKLFVLADILPYVPTLCPSVIILPSFNASRFKGRRGFNPGLMSKLIKRNYNL